MRLVRVPPTPAAQAAEPAVGSPKPASPTKVTKGGARGLTGVLSMVPCMYVRMCVARCWMYCNTHLLYVQDRSACAQHNTLVAIAWCLVLR